jgi:hypothetical protein
MGRIKARRASPDVRRGSVLADEICCGAYVGFCVGFQPPVITELSTHSSGRRLKSAKARNRGGV